MLVPSEGRAFTELLSTPRAKTLIYLLEWPIAVLLLLASLPILAVAALWTWRQSGRSPLIAHLRVGENYLPLWMLKVRTMWDGQPPGDVSGLVEHIIQAPAAAKDPQDGRVGSLFAAFCRRFSVDEIPQLIHVVRGEMSLVGPRPITVEEIAEHYGDDALETLTLRPGLTGLWQVAGRSRLTYAQRRRLDLFLVRHFSVGLYFTILARTVPMVLKGKHAC